MTQAKVGWRSGNLQPVSYLLDTYSGAAAAYSLRKLRTTYTGNAIRVRRSSDNTSQDIGFDANGNLDTTSMLNFVGGYNQIQYSEEFDNAYWTKNGVTVTANNTTAPDGTMTADMITESGNTNHSIRNATATSYPIGTNYNFSVYAKKESISSPDTFALSFADGNISSTYVLFNILNGSVVETYNYYNDSNFGSSIEDVGNGWFRCSVWGTSTVSSNRQTMSIRFTNTSTVNFGYYPARATAKMYIWGYQMTKLGTDLQPYSKTTTTTAGNGFVSIWYDQSGNGYNLIQNTAANQARIINAGSLDTLNGKPALVSNYNSAPNARYTATTSLTSSPFTLFHIGSNAGSASGYLFDGGNGTNRINGRSFNTTSLQVGKSGNVLTLNYTQNITTQRIINVVINGASSKLSINNGSYTTGNTGTQQGLTGITLMAAYDLTQGATAYYQEHILYPSDQSSNIVNIDTNINSYYSIY